MTRELGRKRVNPDERSTSPATGAESRSDSRREFMVRSEDVRIWRDSIAYNCDE